MAYAIVGQNGVKHFRRKGLEGPWEFPNGRVLYYDPKERAHYDASTDIFVEADEVWALQQSLLDLLTK